MTPIHETRVESLGDLVDGATPSRPDPASGRLREPAIYRGLEDPSWHLLTSLDRLGGVDPAHTKVDLEEYIFRNFLRYSRPHLGDLLSGQWEILIAGQHYGLPTRLLDWTYSPLVAAHFATLKAKPGQDCVIWKLNWQEVHQRFDLKPLAYLTTDLDELLDKGGSHSIQNLFRWDEGEDRPFVCMFEPPSLNARIIAQSATFTLASSKSKALDEILVEHGLVSTLTRYIIPAARVSHVRDQLDLCGIDERRLFPELGGVAAEMRRYYGSSSQRIEARGDR